MIKKLSDIISESKQYISNDVSLKDINYLIKETFSLEDIDLILKKDLEFDDLQIVNGLIKLSEGMPVEYVVGHSYFLGNKFIVNKDTLIPRNETEELVLKIINYSNDLNIVNPNILDIGSGTGCIGISLNKLIEGSKVTSVDISEGAIRISKQNNTLNNTNVNFIISDCFNKIDKNIEFNIIVSNPPYIDKNSYVQDSVKKYEPHSALFADNKGLAVYEKIFKECSSYLSAHCLIGLEISPEQENSLIELRNKYLNDFSYQFEEDMNGFVRFMFLIR